MKKKKLLSAVSAVCIFICIGFAVFLYIKSGGAPVSQAPLQDSTLYVEGEIAEKTCYYYKSLTDAQKRAYREFYKAVTNYEPVFTMPVTAAESEIIYDAVLYDNPEIFWLGNEYSYIDYGSSVEVTPTYIHTNEEARQITSRLNEKLDEIVASAASFATDYEKELFFHDYICRNAEYDESLLGKEQGAAAYNLLLNGKAICEGYSRAMQMLLNRVGISNYLIVGNGISDGKSEPHMWNIVELDGRRYHLDVTWDDAEAYREPSHLYFNLSTSEILIDHSDLSPAAEECVSTDAGYFRKNGQYIYEFDSLTDLCDKMIEIVNSGSHQAEFVFENQSDYQQAVDIIYNDNEMLFKAVRRVSRGTGGNVLADKVEYMNDDKRRYICITFIDNR